MKLFQIKYFLWLILFNTQYLLANNNEIQQNSIKLDAIFDNLIIKTAILDKNIADIISGASLSKKQYEKQQQDILSETIQQFEKIGKASFLKKKTLVTSTNAVLKEKKTLYHLSPLWHIDKQNLHWEQRKIGFYTKIKQYLSILNKLKKHEQIDLSSYKKIQQYIIKSVKSHTFSYDKKSLYSLAPSNIPDLLKAKKVLVFDIDKLNIKSIENIFYRASTRIKPKQIMVVKPETPITSSSNPPKKNSIGKMKLGIHIYGNTEIVFSEDRDFLMQQFSKLCSYITKINQKYNKKYPINWLFLSKQDIIYMKQLLPNKLNNCINLKITKNKFENPAIEVYMPPNLIQINICKKGLLNCISDINLLLNQEVK